MNDITITFDELSALSGLPHIQQLTYLIGLRPYVDYKTGLVGIKRGVSYQSISEALYVEPHPGISGGSPSKAQLRRALSGLERAGLISIQSTEKKLIARCNLVNLNYSAQNKVVTNPSQETVIEKDNESLVAYGEEGASTFKPVPPKTVKAVIPLINNNLNNNNTNSDSEFSSSQKTKKTINPDFYPSPETLTRAFAAGYGFAASAEVIQEFIDKNISWGSQFADFNPVYLNFLSQYDSFQQKKAQATTQLTRSHNNERYTPKENSHEALMARARQANANATAPSEYSELFPASRVIGLEESQAHSQPHIMALA